MSPRFTTEMETFLDDNESRDKLHLLKREGIWKEWISSTTMSDIMEWLRNATLKTMEREDIDKMARLCNEVVKLRAQLATLQKEAGKLRDALDKPLKDEKTKHLNRLTDITKYNIGGTDTDYSQPGKIENTLANFDKYIEEGTDG